MKAITYANYGPANVMTLSDIPQPTAGEGEVLIRVRAASINPVDWKIREGLMKIVTGKRFPRGMGVDVAGVVASVGVGVSSLAPGDEVFGWIPYKTSGAFAEYAVVPAETVEKKPASVGFEEAACLPMAGTTAYKSLVEKAGLKAGDKVLINGCTGGVGLFALQIAKAKGAAVTGTCRGANAALAEDNGADVVIDYREANVLELGARYDVILEASGRLSYKEAKRILAKGGRFLDLNPTPSGVLKGLLSSKYFAIMTSVDHGDLEALSRMAQSSEVRAHVSHRVSLSAAVEDITVMESGRSVTGKAVIIME